MEYFHTFRIEIVPTTRESTKVTFSVDERSSLGKQSSRINPLFCYNYFDDEKHERGNQFARSKMFEKEKNDHDKSISIMSTSSKRENETS